MFWMAHVCEMKNWPASPTTLRAISPNLQLGSRSADPVMRIPRSESRLIQAKREVVESFAAGNPGQ